MISSYQGPSGFTKDLEVDTWRVVELKLAAGTTNFSILPALSAGQVGAPFVLLVYCETEDVTWSPSVSGAARYAMRELRPFELTFENPWTAGQTPELEFVNAGAAAVDVVLLFGLKDATTTGDSNHVLRVAASLEYQDGVRQVAISVEEVSSKSGEPKGRILTAYGRWRVERNFGGGRLRTDSNVAKAIQLDSFDSAKRHCLVVAAPVTATDVKWSGVDTVNVRDFWIVTAVPDGEAIEVSSDVDGEWFAWEGPASADEGTWPGGVTTGGETI